MTKLQFVKATKSKARARLALVGPSNSGKTFSALRISRGLIGDEGRVALIDSEHGSASLYAGKGGFDFDTVELPDHAPATYVQALELAASEGYDAIIVDSLSHAWAGRGGALEMVDAISAASRNDNQWAAWAKVTPEHTKLVEALLAFPGHLIATMRTKTAYTVEEYQDKRGRTKSRPVKIGLEPVQRAGVEYEFDFVGTLDQSHVMTITKTRNEELDGLEIERPGEDFGEQIRAWLDDGADPLEAWRDRVAEAEATGSLQPFLGPDGLQVRVASLGGSYATEARGLVDAGLCRVVAARAKDLDRKAVLGALQIVEAAQPSGDQKAASTALSKRLEALDAEVEAAAAAD